jgi:hypothetical protein
MQSTDRRTFVGGHRIFSDTYNLCPPPPLEWRIKFSVFQWGAQAQLNSLNTNRVLSFCSHIALRLQMLQTFKCLTVRGVSAPTPITLFKCVIIITPVIMLQNTSLCICWYRPLYWGFSTLTQAYCIRTPNWVHSFISRGAAYQAGLSALCSRRSELYLGI